MKLPSLALALTAAQQTFKRFPVIVLDAIVGTIVALILIDYEGPAGPTFLFQVLAASVMCFPLLTGLALVAEKRGWSYGVALVIQGGGVVLAALYALTVPQDLLSAPAYYVIRLALLSGSFVLFAFSVPFLGHESELGYWNFCKSLILRIITAYLYTVVLWAGLAIALAALDNLFGVNIPGKRYGELWVFINGVFTTWFFLAGIPDDLGGLDAETDHPKGLKIFSQYILFPLVCVYLIILYAYLGKILIEWEWPEGWVSKLILGFIGTGIASILLLHPIKEQIENVWIKRASRWFYVIIIPLLVMLFFAVWRRVSEYGITEGRYLAIASGMWLCVVVLYYIVSRRKSIRFLPFSLCVGVFLVSFGPWGMLHVSEKSQVGRLAELLKKNGILVDGHVQSKHDSVQFNDTKQISSIISYLSEIHGFESIQPWFAESLKGGLPEAPSKFKESPAIAKMMGIEYVRVWQFSSGGTMFLMADRDAPLVLDGYDRLVRSQRINPGVAKKEFPDPRISYRIGKELDVMAIIVSAGAQKVDSLQFDLQPLVKRLTADYGNVTTDKIPPEKMAIDAANQSIRVKLWLTNLRIQRRGGQAKVLSYDADIAFKFLGEK